MATFDGLFCNDADVANRCKGDFARIASRAKLMAKGDDGAFVSDGWTLQSADGQNDFQVEGIPAGMVLIVRQGGVQPDDELEIATVPTGNLLTLKRLGVAAGEGMPPIPAAAVAIQYECRTVIEDIATVTKQLREEYGIAAPAAPPADFAETFKQLCICMVLRDLYREQARQSQGPGDDYTGKLRLYQTCIDAHEKRLAALFEVDVPGGVPFAAPLPTRDARPLYGPWPDAHPYDLDWRGRR